MEEPWIITTVISTATAIITTLGWIASRKAANDAAWALEYQAFQQAEMEANTDAFLKIHGITNNDLVEHGLDRDTFRAYMLWLNVVWAASRTHHGRFWVRLTSNYEKKVTVAGRYVWPRETRIGQLLRSPAFREAWPLLCRFWGRAKRSVVSPLIEATMQDI